MEKAQIETVLLNAQEMTSWDYLHDHFSQLFGFPASYNRTTDAWVDSMTFLDQKENQASYTLRADAFTIIEIFNAVDLSPVQYEILQSLIDCACLVNFKRLALCLKPYILLSYHKQSSR